MAQLKHKTLSEKIKEDIAERISLEIGPDTPRGTALKWVFAESLAPLCESLWFFFHDEADVIVKNCTFSKLDQKDFPENSAIIMQGSNPHGIHSDTAREEQEIQGFFGTQVLAGVRNYIIEHYSGEAPVYTSFIVPTANPIIPWMIYVVGGIGNMKNAYPPLWGAVSTVNRFNQQQKASNGKQISALVLRASRCSADQNDESARQNYIAYLTQRYPPKKEELTLTYSQAKSELLTKTFCLSDVEKRIHTVQMLLTVAYEAIEFLIFLIEASERDIQLKLGTYEIKDLSQLRLSAAKSIVRYTFPEEFRPGFASLVLQNKATVSFLLLQIEKETLKAHSEIKPSEISLNKKIYQGAGGTVYEAVYKDRVVAVKTIGIENISFNRKDWLRELGLMSILRHRGLVEFYGACTQDENLFLVSKLLPLGTVGNLLQLKSIEIDFHVLLKFSMESCEIIDFLHSNGILHRDIKSLNFLLESGLDTRLIDFGTSRIINASMTNAIGTTAWMAPELFQSQPYGEKSDIYSLGIYFWELISRSIPFESLTNFQIPVAVSKGERPVIPKHAPKEYEKLIRKCWTHRANQRPSASEILGELKKIEKMTPPKDELRKLISQIETQILQLM